MDEINEGNVLQYFGVAANFTDRWNDNWSDEQKALFLRLANAAHQRGFDWYATGIPDLRIGRKDLNGDPVQVLAHLELQNRGVGFRWGGVAGIALLNEQLCGVFESPILEGMPQGARQVQPLVERNGHWPIDYVHEGPLPPPPPPPPLMKLPINTILYGPPGTGKTFSTTALALSLLSDDMAARTYATRLQAGGDYAKPPDQAGWRSWIAKFDELRRRGRVEVTTFHQNYAYEDFVEGLRADVVPKGDGSTSVGYKIEPGIFKRIAYCAMYAWLKGEEAPRPVGNGRLADVVIQVVDTWLATGVMPVKAEGADVPSGGLPYLLIIDEINRGNMARILGELITLLEDSKRAKDLDKIQPGDQPFAATLPYTKMPFMVPPNLYIIGTMNTADRSLVGLDLALRRRFSFVELPPRPKALTTEVQGGDGQPPLNLEAFLKELNDRIERVFDRDHTIGHAYLTRVTTMDELKQAMRDKVIPQLLEYFHDRPQSLQAVLKGSDFVGFKTEPLRVTGLNNDKLGDIASYRSLIAAA